MKWGKNVRETGTVYAFMILSIIWNSILKCKWIVKYLQQCIVILIEPNNPCKRFAEESFSWALWRYRVYAYSSICTYICMCLCVHPSVHPTARLPLLPLAGSSINPFVRPSDKLWQWNLLNFISTTGGLQNPILLHIKFSSSNNETLRYWKFEYINFFYA